MFRYVVPWIPADATRWQELAYYLVACLFALHPQPGGRGNLGSHLRVLLSRGASSDTVERRFTALLAAHPDDLATHLRHAVSLLRGANIPINWEQLFWDVWNWHDPERREHVLKDWARAYWGAESKDRGGLPCL
jgi:CRISPR system Cascade subunit CasB